MRFNLRWRRRIGPFQINGSRGHVTSWSVFPFWPFTRRASWNSRTRRLTADTPGPGYVSTEPTSLGRILGFLALCTGTSLAAVAAVVAAAWTSLR